MLAPFAIQRGPIPSTNYSASGGPKIGVAVHVIEGSADSAMAEFHNVGAQLSAHFVVAGPGDPYPDGMIFQLLDTDLCAYAQAAGNYPPTAYIAVEFSGTVATAMSPDQILAAAKIVSWASVEHGFPIVGEVPHGTPGVTTHCNPDGSPDPNWGDHPCPGPLRLAQIPTIVTIAKGPPASPPPAPSVDTNHMEILMSLAANKSDALNCQIREWWATYRSDPLTVAAVGYLVAGYNGPWGGSIDKVLATIIDTAQGHLRPQFAGAA